MTAFCNGPLSTAATVEALEDLRPTRHATNLAVDAREGWGRMRIEIANLMRLQDDWDGMGSPAPRGSVVIGTLQACCALAAGGAMVPGRIYAGPNGTVTLAWQDDSGYLELEILNAGEAEHRFYPTDGESRIEVVKIPQSSIQTTVSVPIETNEFRSTSYASSLSP